MKLLLTGTPGVGKTTLSMKLAAQYNLIHIDISKLIKDQKLYDEYDKEFDTFVFNERKIRRYLKKFLKSIDSYIIDTHSPELVNFVDFDHIFLIKVPIKELHSRLEQRGYNLKKIQENTRCEIFGVIEEILMENDMEYHLVGDEDETLSVDQVLDQIQKHIKKNDNCRK